MANNQRFIEQFRERLGLFCFFHLGSDAEINVREDTEGLKVTISHKRVTPFEFIVPWAQVQSIAGDSDRFEALMLGHLTRYRRS